MRLPAFFPSALLPTLNVVALEESLQMTADRSVRAGRDVAEPRFRRLFNESPLPMFVIEGRSLRFLAVNDTACEHYKYTRDQFARMTLGDVHPGRQRVIPIRAFRDRGATDFSGTAQHVCGDGRVIEVELLAHRIGFLPMPAWLVVIHDITARREAEELRVRLLAAENAARLKDLMVSAISHELRTPVAALRGNLSTALEYWDRLDAAEIKNLVEAADGATRRLGSLIDDLLLLSRLEAGTIALHPSRFDLADLVRERVRECRRSAPDREFEMHGVAAIEVEADRQKVGIIIGNLLDNASKYSPPGHPVAISLDEAGDGAAVSVRDQGPGVPTRDLTMIFEPFYRTRRAVSSRAPGAGLGLAISRAIATSHGGSLQARNNGDGGLTVTLYLPLHPQGRD
jgi:PAS domain S-box-containing protein